MMCPHVPDGLTSKTNTHLSGSVLIFITICTISCPLLVQKKTVHTNQTIRNQHKKLEGTGEASFDTQIMTLSHADSKKENHVCALGSTS